MDDDSIFYPNLASLFSRNCFNKIQKVLDLNFSDDEISRDMVDEWIKKNEESGGRSTILHPEMTLPTKQRCLIFTPGPTLEQMFEKCIPLFQKNDEEEIIAVDGAARIFLENNIKVKYVITDLDGLTMNELVRLHDEQSSTIFIHVHGDNIDAVRETIDKIDLSGQYFFTTQVAPTRRVFNLGGFTDGDRAIFIAVFLGFTEINLISMDLDSQQIGRYSKQFLFGEENQESREYQAMKIKKLKVAIRIIKWLSMNVPANIFIRTVEKLNPFSFIPNVLLKEVLKV